MILQLIHQRNLESKSAKHNTRPFQLRGQRHPFCVFLPDFKCTQFMQALLKSYLPSLQSPPHQWDLQLSHLSCDVGDTSKNAAKSAKRVSSKGYHRNRPALFDACHGKKSFNVSFFHGSKRTVKTCLLKGILLSATNRYWVCYVCVLGIQN